MADLNIGISVKDRVQAGINSVLNNLRRQIPGEIQIGTRVVDSGRAFEYIKHAMEAAGKDATKLTRRMQFFDEVLSKVEKDGKSVFGENYFSSFMSDTDTSINKLAVLRNNLDRLKSQNRDIRVGQLNTYKDANSFYETSLKGVLSGDSNVIKKVLEMSANGDIRAMENAVRTAITKRFSQTPTGKEFKENIEKYNSAISSMLGNLSSRMGGTKMLTTISTAHAKIQDLVNSIHKTSTEKGFENPILQSEKFVSLLTEAAGRLQNLQNTMKKNVTMFGKETAQKINAPLASNASLLRNSIDAALKGGVGSAGAMQLQNYFDAHTYQSANNLSSAIKQTYVEAQEAARKFGDRIDGVTKKLNHQSRTAQELRNYIVGMYSLQQVGQFLRNIIEIGGQFEYQRATIGHILGDAGKADALFNQIKGLALSSPFSTLELDESVKRLSAFNVQYNELYKKTKMIGDISAATGTDINRIIYAYGHVKSQGFLNAMQMRMFTNANIPMLPELQKLLSEREGRTVTRDAVYKRMKERGVTAEDVDEVLNRLAGPGGKFENMQEVMGDTVKGVWKNLGDAINHMYMDIESSNSESLKNLGRSLTSVVNNVKTMIPYIQTAVGIFGAWKAVTYALSVAGGKESAMRIRAIQVLNQEDAARLRTISTYRSLNVTETASLASLKAITAQQIVDALATDKLTEAQVYQAVAARRLSVEQAQLAVNEGFLTKQGLLRAAAMRTLTGQFRLMFSSSNAMRNIIPTLINNIKSFGVAVGTSFTKGATSIKAFFTSWKTMQATVKTGALNLGHAVDLGLGSIVNTARLAGVAIKGMLASFGPMLAVMAAMEAYTAWQQKKEDRKQREEDYRTGVSERYYNINGTTDNYAKANFGLMSKEERKSAREELEEAIKDNLADGERILASIKEKDEQGGFLHNTAEQCQMMYDALTGTNESMKRFEKQGLNIAGALDYAAQNSGTDYNFNNIAENLQDIEKQSRRTQTQLTRLSKGAKESLSGYLKGLAGNDAEFKKLNDNLYQQIVYLTEIGKLSKENFTRGQEGDYRPGKYQDEFGDGNISTLIGTIENIKAALPAFEAKMGDALQSMDATEYKQSLYEWMQYALKMPPQMANQWARFFTEQKFNMTITADVEVKEKEPKKIYGWMYQLEKEIKGKQYSIEIRTSTDIADALEKCKKLYDETKKKWDLLVKQKDTFKINIDFGMVVKDPDKLKKLINAQLNLARLNYKNEGKHTENRKEYGAQIDYLKEMLEMVDTMSVDPEKFDNSNKKGKQGSVDTRDRAYETWQKQMRQIEETRTAYEDLVKTFGKDEAMDKLLANETYAKVIDALFPNADAIKNAGKITEQDFEKAYRSMAEKVEGLAKPTDWNKFTDEQKNYLIENRKAGIADANQRADKSGNLWTREQTELAISNIDRYMDEQKKAYDIYKRVYEATGSKGTASMMAGISPFDNQVKRARQDLQSAIDANSKLFPESSLKSVDDILLMTEKEIEKLPDAVKKAYTSWRNEIDSLAKAQQDALINMLAQNKSYATELNRIQQKFDTNAAVISATTKEGSAERDRLNHANEAQRNWSALQLSADYANFMENSLGLSYKAMMTTYNDILMKLNDQFAAGNISASEYEKTLKDLNEKVFQKSLKQGNSVLGNFGTDGQKNYMLRHLGNGEFESGLFSKKGVSTLSQGFVTTMLNPMKLALAGTNAKDLQAYAHSQLEAAQKNRDEVLAKEGTTAEERVAAQKELEEKEAQAAAADKFVSNLNAVGSVLSMINGVAEGLAGAFNALADTFYSFGNKKAGNRMSNIADGITAGFSFLDPVNGIVSSAMSGDISGVISNAIQAPIKLFTGPITAFNKLHDKKLSQQIDLLKEQNGHLKVGFGKLQKDFDRGFGVQKGNTQEQLNNLTAQRDNVQKQYNAENDKKNSDQGSLDEYQSQLNDLNDQIAYFASDLAKTLYGLDLKEWGSELSDAMIEAFRNGEDAALVWRQKVGDLVRQVTGEYIKQKLIMDRIKPVFDEFFGYEDANGKKVTGIFGENLENLDEKTLAELASKTQDKFNTDFLGDAEQIWRYITGIFPDSSDDKGTGGLSKVGQSMTEDTGGLISSYVNSIRADLSYNRINIEAIKFALSDNGQSVSSIASAQLQQLQMIKSDTSQLVSLFNAVTTGTKRVYMQ